MSGSQFSPVHSAETAVGSGKAGSVQGKAPSIQDVVTMATTPGLPASDRAQRARPQDRLTRNQAAEFVLRYETRIRQIARRKLTQATRGAFDSEDVVASVLRRVDQLAANGTLCPENEAELWSLIKTIASNTAVSKTRLIERTRFLLTEDDAYAYYLLQRLNACTTDDEAQLLVLRMAHALPSERSRQIFFLRLRGATHAAIAGVLSIGEGACRQQWMQMCHELRAAFEGRTIHA